MREARISVVIPTLNAAVSLPATLAALEEGPVAETLIVDGGSTDGTLEMAVRKGCRVIEALRGRGLQLAAGARAARADWLLFLHADTVLERGWGDEARAHLTASECAERAAVFRFAIDGDGRSARRLERLVRWRCRVFGLPYGDQGLLISRDLYDRVGGYGDEPLMEDVALMRRLGRRRLRFVTSRAFTSAARFEAGYLRRSLRNLACLALYFVGVPPRRIARLYE